MSLVKQGMQADMVLHSSCLDHHPRLSGVLGVSRGAGYMGKQPWEICWMCRAWRRGRAQHYWYPGWVRTLKASWHFWFMGMWKMIRQVVGTVMNQATNSVVNCFVSQRVTLTAQLQLFMASCSWGCYTNAIGAAVSVWEDKVNLLGTTLIFAWHLWASRFLLPMGRVSSINPEGHKGVASDRWEKSYRDLSPPRHIYTHITTFCVMKLLLQFFHRTANIFPTLVIFQSLMLP